MEDGLEHSEKNPEKSKRIFRRFFVGAAISLLILGVCLVFLWNRMQTAVKPFSDPVIESVTLDDGSQFQVIATDFTNSFMKSRRYAPGLTALKMWSSKTNGWGNHDFIIKQEKGLLDSVEMRGDGGRNDLILQIRLLNSEGEEVIPQHTRNTSEKSLYEIARSKDGIFERFERVPASAFPVPEQEVVLNIGNGDGGWIPTTGPVAFDGKDGRSFVAVEVFPRNEKTIKVQMLRAGLPPAEFEIKNPSFSPTPKPEWVLDKKPWEKKLSEANVVLTGIDKLNRTSPKRIVPLPNFKILPFGSQMPNAYRVRDSFIEDVHGNKIPATRFHVLPKTKALRFHCTFQRTEKYQWSRPEIRMIGQGVTGKEIESLKTLAAGKKMGIESLQVERAPAGSSYRWNFLLKGKAQQSDIPDPLRFIVFENGEIRSDKVSMSLNGGSSTHPSGETEYEYTVGHRANLKTGSKIMIGLLPAPAVENFEFTVPIDPVFLP